MTDHSDLDRRIEKLEEQDVKMNEALQQLIISTTRMSDLLEQQVSYQKDIVPRLRQLEIDSANTKLINKAVAWLAMTIGGSAIVLVMAFLFGG